MNLRSPPAVRRRVGTGEGRRRRRAAGPEHPRPRPRPRGGREAAVVVGRRPRGDAPPPRRTRPSVSGAGGAQHARAALTGVEGARAVVAVRPEHRHTAG